MAKFSEILTIINGKNQKQVENPNGKYPIYGSGGIMGYADDFICNGETVIIGRKGSINKPIFVDGPFWNVDTAFGLSAKKDVLLPKYLYYFCEIFDFEQLNTTVTIPSLTKVNLQNIEIRLPSISAQQSIVAVLDKITILISLRKQQLAKLDELVKAWFVEMFGDPVSNPMNWATKPLKDECLIITGNTPARKVEKYYGDYIEWIKSDNINTPQAILTVAEEGLSKEGLAVGRVVDADSILMTCIAGSIGCIGNVAIANRKVAFNQQINGIVPNNNVWFMYTQFELSKKAIQSSINMALKGILSKGQLSEMKFIFPPIEFQNKYGHFAVQIDKSKLTIQQSLNKLEVLKKSLMQEYFR